MITVSGSSAGLVRESNQDSYMAGKFSENAVWAVICDGMGGVNGGSVASSLAVKAISESIVSNFREDIQPPSVRGLLASAVSAGNIAVYQRAQRDKDLAGMGTTVVVTLILNKTVYISHAGDSRAYLFKNGRLDQLTRDHSVVQSMIETGQITPDEAKNHPSKHVITRALGVAGRVDTDYAELPVDPGDIILLCTDGLTNYADEEGIVQTLTGNEFADVPAKLIELAETGGGGDNITVVLIKI